MQSFKIIERIRKASPDPVKYLRLNRAEFGSTYKIKNYDYNHYYPDINPLIKTASNFYNVKKDLIYIGLGAESVIRDILLLYSLKKKKNCIGFNSPNFFMYKYYSKLFSYSQKEYLIIPDKIKHLSVQHIKKFIKKKKINFFTLVNPSHPFEKYWSLKEVEEIIKFCNKLNITILIDEVYQGIGSKSAIKLIKKYNNLIILKSLSKASGLPGLRVGFAISTKKNIDELNTVRLAIELPENSIKEAVLHLKNYKKLIYPKIKMIYSAREYAHRQFKKRKIRSFGNYGNSVTFRFEDNINIKKVGDFLKKNKIIVNYQYPEPLDRYMNITTTNVKNLRYFFNTLDKIL